VYDHFSAMTILERPRLLHQINAALQTGHLLIHAPAGYGKTTLIQHLIRQRPHSVYVACTSADIDLVHLAARVQAHLQPEQTIILDDVHLLAAGTESRGWLQDLLRRATPRLVLSGRHFLGWDLPLAESEASMNRLTEQDLAFSASETTTLLKRQYPTRPLSVMEAWRQRLEGWPLGLQLLTQLAHQPDPLPAAETYLFDYLLRAVFADLPPSLQHFLQVTTVPLQFSDELATHLLGNEDGTALRRQVQQRGLFLEAAQEPGWFRYHDLVREALLRQGDRNRADEFLTVSRWFQGQGDPFNAIEHLLAGGLQQEAAQTILSLPVNHIYEHERYRTYQRWIAQLDSQIRDQYPGLSLWLGHFLHFLPGEDARARQAVQQALALAEAVCDREVAVSAQIQLVSFDLHDLGATPEIVGKLEALSREPDLSAKMGVRIQRLLAQALSDLALFRQARRAWERAIVLAQREGLEQEIWSNRRGLALYVLVPLGHFQRAQEIFTGVLAYFTGNPGWSYEILQNVCDFYAAQGDWGKLADTLARIDEMLALLEVDAGYNQIWVHYARAQLAIAQQEYTRAEQHLVQMTPLIEDYPIGQFCQSIARVWLARRQGQDVSATVQKYLSQPSDLLVYQALLALEVDIAQVLVGKGNRPFLLHTHTQYLIRWRCRADLVRLRALLAVVCWQHKDPRWRRHVSAALYTLKTYWGYENLLSQRDPDLGAHFWPLALVAGIDNEEIHEQALAALRKIGQSRPLYPLLAHEEASVRMQAAQGLAAIGSEEALPLLAEASAQERDKSAKAVLDAAMGVLERQPPPPLRVQMLGGFRLWRGEGEILPNAWSRPIVLRLFQYFALHRGKILSRDRVLDDLWPDTDPEKAWVTLRNVYSRLRSVLEPFVQSKGFNRYVAFDGGSYTIDPQNVMAVDLEQFEQTVRRTLQDARSADVRPLPPAFLAALEGYALLLPELPFEEWLLETRQRLADLYTDGTLYATEALLIRGEPAQAENWARQAIASAPWLEEAYVALIRALARQGQRSAALRTYETAVAALHRELDASPSPQTEWIAQRLRRGEEV